MKILLINSNPVVSRLTSLSARKEGVEIDEIKDISELKNSKYNIVFVDLDSFTKNTANVLKNSNITKRVCFYTQDDKDIDEVFNFQILKPFLPSEVSAIIREVKMELEEQEENKTQEHVDLDELISNKKDDLTPLNIQESNKEEDSTQDKILEEINTAKEQLEEIKKESIKEIEPVLQTKEEDSIVETKDTEIDTEIDLKSTEESLEDDKNEKIESIKEEKTKEVNDDELFELDSSENSETKQDSKDELFTLDIKEDNKEKEKEEDELLKFDLESQEEVTFEPEEENEDSDTKILDKDEISNIKNLLNEESTPDNLSLEDIMTPPSTPIATLVDTDTKKKKKKKKKAKKAKEKIVQIEEEIQTGTEVITKTIQAMPVEELRQLLRGTKIHITIEFPNDI